MSIEGQGHFFTIYFPGFVCFVLYLDKISGERLQDHWSSGYKDLTKIIFQLSSYQKHILSVLLGKEQSLSNTIFWIHRFLAGAVGSMSLLAHYANTPIQYTAIFHSCKNVYFQMEIF